MTRSNTRATANLPALQGLRALAAVAIVTYHLWQNGGHRVNGHLSYAFDQSRLGSALMQSLLAGVSVYFVLSGFLLSRPFLRAALLGEPLPDIREWVRRRSFRILPLYWLLIVAMWSSRNVRWPGDWRDLLEHLTFTQDFDGKRIFYTLGPGWSMASEVKFYVTLAALGWLWTRSTKRLTSQRVRLVVLALPIVALYGFSMAFKWWIFDHRGVSLYQYQWSYSFPTRLDGFCVGMAVGLWCAHRDVLQKPCWRQMSGLWLVPALVLFFAAGWYQGNMSVEGTVWLYPVMSLATAPLLMTLVAAQESVVTRTLSWPPLVRLGVMSYSIYLIHEPVLLQLTSWGWVDGRQPYFFLQLALLFAVVWLATLVCYLGIEKPGLQLLKLWERGKPREYYPHLVQAKLPPQPAGPLVLVGAERR